jgi:hypothetical protein
VHRPIAWIEDHELLASDSRFRLDRMLFVRGGGPKANEIKVVIEECQRREKNFGKQFRVDQILP